MADEECRKKRQGAALSERTGDARCLRKLPELGGREDSLPYRLQTDDG